MREPNLDNSVTIGIPVGPENHHKNYLREAFDSAISIPENSPILLIDDMAGIEASDLGCQGFWIQHGPHLEQLRSGELTSHQDVLRYRTPWRMGVASAFNLCVAMAPTQFVLMMGADDTLEPNVIQEFRKACPFPLRDRALQTFWGLPLRYMDTGEEQGLPCNAAIVSRELWKHTGGFAPEMSVGACDSMLLSCMIGAEGRAGDVRMLEGPPLYNYRRHNLTDTAMRGDYQASIFQVRDNLTKAWKPTTWGRYAV